MEQSSERDLDRSWPAEEVASLSEGELTKLAFLRDYKNFVFFLPAGYALYLVGGFGMIGKIIGWIGVVMFGIFALYGLFNTLFGLVVLLGTPFMEKAARVKKTFWRSLQFLITFGNFAIYTALAILVYAGIYNGRLQDYVPW